MNASLHIKLKDTDPFQSFEEPEKTYAEDGEAIPIEALEESQISDKHRQKYLIHVRALVYKKLVMSWNDKTKSLKYLMLDDATKENLIE